MAQAVMNISDLTQCISDALYLRRSPEVCLPALTFWHFYSLLCFLAILNLGLTVYAWKRTASASDAYGTQMRWLALPFVWECAWRSVLPSLYLQRFVVWDTPCNAILVDRTWACIGELTWTYQIALALRTIDIQLSASSSGSKWIQFSGWLAVFIYVVAECVSYYNTATKNEFWAAIEVICDGASFVVMIPAAVFLTYRQFSHKWSSGKVFTTILSIVTVVYPLYNFTVDAPMYFQRYKADQAAHKHYLPFFEGLKDSAVTRNMTHNTSDWSGDMTWMIIYFSVGVWSSILLMWAPKADLSVTHTRLVRNNNKLEEGSYIIMDPKETSLDQV